MNIKLFTEEEKKELAIEIGEYWNENCTDDDFYDNCMDEILEEIGFDFEGPIPNIAYEIWNIIENKFC